MRALITAIFVFVAAAAGAMAPEYDSSRRWVEQNNSADKTRATKRVFVVYSTNSLILRFHEGMSLREIVDATPLKGKAVTVYILRESQKTKPVFDEKAEASAKPSFQTRPRDLLFIHLAGGVPRW